MSLSRRSFLQRLGLGVAAALVSANTAFGSRQPQLEPPQETESEPNEMLTRFEEAIYEMANAPIANQDFVFLVSPKQAEDLGVNLAMIPHEEVSWD